MTTADSAAHMTTDALWTATHDALMQGRWSAGVALLEELGRRGDCRDCLCSLATYQRAARLDGRNDLADRKWWGVRSQLDDRIQGVNYRVENRADGY